MTQNVPASPMFGSQQPEPL